MVDELIGRLINYAAHSKEGTPAFRAYLSEVVLRDIATREDRADRVEYHLRNWEIKEKLGGPLGPVFLRMIRKYRVYSLLFPPDGRRLDLPFDPIPQRYLVGDVSDVAGDESGGEEEEEEEKGEEESDSSDDDDGYRLSRFRRGRSEEPRRAAHPRGNKSKKRSRSLQLKQPNPDYSSHVHPSKRPRLSEAGTGPGTLGSPSERSRLLAILASIPRFAAPDHLLPNLESLSRTGPDWTQESWYKTSVQPPLAMRLETVINFLCDEDVDRAVGWNTEFPAIVEYLAWLASEDDETGREQLRGASEQTRAMFDDAVDKAKTHLRYERFHYDPATLNIGSVAPPTVPRRTTRLDWVVGPGGWAGVPLQHEDRPSSCCSRDCGPRDVLPLPRERVSSGNEPVNGMMVGENPELSERFAEGEDAFWDSSANGTGDAGLVETEEDAFIGVVVGDGIGWIRQDAATGRTRLPDGTETAAGDEESWARERGARRAGLMQMLRRYGTMQMESATRSGPRRPFILPNDAATLRRAREKADGVQWTPNALPHDEITHAVEGKLHRAETMPYNISFTQTYLAALKQLREAAYLKVTAGHDDQFQRDSFQEGAGDVSGTVGAGRAVALPKNVINGGPFVWRGVSEQTEHVQDLLDASLKTLKILRAAGIRQGKPDEARDKEREYEHKKLLADVLGLAEKGARGQIASARHHMPPSSVQLDPEEDYSSYLLSSSSGAGSSRGPSGQRKPRFVGPADLQWLEFLASDPTNERNYTGKFKPDGLNNNAKAKYRLFLVFARRVQRLLDDRDPTGLFAKHDAEVSVEKLLEVINNRGTVGSTGGGGPAIDKVQFGPYDACFFLHRLKQSGHVRYEWSPLDYGTVRRPRGTLFPEMRVIFPSGSGQQQERPPAFVGFVSDWARVVEAGGKNPGDPDGSRAQRFFKALAFRLGYTIHQLRKQYVGRQQSVETDAVRDALDRFREECEKLEGDEAKKSRLDLLRLVSRLEEKRINGKNEKPHKGYTLSLQEEEELLAILRTRIIDEIVENANMLVPARRETYFDKDTGKRRHRYVLGEGLATLWDWASTEVRPATTRKRKQFWDMNRWPVGTGYLSKRAEKMVLGEKGEDVHSSFVGGVTYDPAKLDPTDEQWVFPKMRRIGADPENEGKFKHRPGPAHYPVGDTALQRRVVEKRLTDMAYDGEFALSPFYFYYYYWVRIVLLMLWDVIAMGLEKPQPKPTWADIIPRWIPFPRPAEDDGELDKEERLPPVDDKKLLRSWDPERLRDALEEDGEDDTADDEESTGDVASDDESVDGDVTMGGLGADGELMSGAL